MPKLTSRHNGPLHKYSHAQVAAPRHRHVAGEQECVGKIGYDSAGEAYTTLREMRRRKSNMALQPYRCQHCGRWHLGRSSTAD